MKTETDTSIDTQLLRKMQLRMVEILVAIDDICRRHKLRYAIAYGTLLGAVRHKGFIPWDDDCDIFMPRADYEKFAEVAITELPKNMFLQDRKTDPKYPQYKKSTPPKVRLRDTKVVAVDEKEEEQYCQGIFVDIFIGDFYPSFVLPLIKFLKIDWNRRRYAKGTLKRVLYNIAITIPVVVHKIFKMLFFRCCDFWRKNERLPYIGWEARLCDVKFVHRACLWFSTKEEGIFEGRCFPVPNDSEALLRDWYGDYMTPTPPEDRHPHFRAIIKV